MASYPEIHYMLILDLIAALLLAIGLVLLIMSWRYRSEEWSESGRFSAEKLKPFWKTRHLLTGPGFRKYVCATCSIVLGAVLMLVSSYLDNGSVLGVRF